MKLKSKCCLKYVSQAKACKSCPLMAGCSKKKRRKKLAGIKKRLKRAA